MLEKIHHINFLVRDLDEAVERYESLFGVTVTHREALQHRGAATARFRVGEVWIVLVQPTDPQGVPARHLERHGEGFFLISYQVDDVALAARSVRERGGPTLHEEPRRGLEDWRVVDLDPAATLGVHTQLVDTRG